VQIYRRRRRDICHHAAAEFRPSRDGATEATLKADGIASLTVSRYFNPNTELDHQNNDRTTIQAATGGFNGTPHWRGLMNVNHNLDVWSTFAQQLHRCRTAEQPV
jgi:hypothetical protein